MTKISPGVYIKIIDLSEYVNQVPGTIGCICILSKKGPDNELIFIGSQEELFKLFGTPNIDEFGKDYSQGLYIANNFIKESGALFLTRCMPDDSSFSNLRISLCKDYGDDNLYIEESYISKNESNTEQELKTKLESEIIEYPYIDPGYPAPVILTQPIGGEIEEENDFEFSIHAIGENIQYQWYFNDQIILGATNSTYNIYDAILEEIGNYKCRVYNSGGELWSDEVYLEIFEILNNFLIVSSEGSPYVQVYNARISNSIVLNPSPTGTDLPSSAGYGSSVSKDGKFVAVGHENSPYLTIYEKNRDIFTKINNYDSPPIGYVRQIAFSPDNSMMACSHWVSPYITLYNYDFLDNVFRKLDSSVLGENPTGVGYGCAFCPKKEYLAVSHFQSPYITLYKTVSTLITKLSDPTDLPTGNAYSVKFSINRNYMAVTHAISPFVTIYKIEDNDVFTKLNTPDILDIPSEIGFGCAFSPDNNYFTVVSLGYPYLYLYKINNDTDEFTRINISSEIVPPNIAYGVDFNASSQYFAVAHQDSPYLSYYRIVNDIVTKINTPESDELPNDTGYSVTFYPSSHFDYELLFTYPNYEFGESSGEEILEGSSFSVVIDNEIEEHYAESSGEEILEGNSFSTVIDNEIEEHYAESSGEEILSGTIRVTVTDNEIEEHYAESSGEEILQGYKT